MEDRKRLVGQTLRQTEAVVKTGRLGSTGGPSELGHVVVLESALNQIVPNLREEKNRKHSFIWIFDSNLAVDDNSLNSAVQSARDLRRFVDGVEIVDSAHEERRLQIEFA